MATMPEDYGTRLDAYAEDVAAYGGRLVLMTTTPVIEQVHNSPTGVQSRRLERGRRPNLRFNDDIDMYNEIMREIAESRSLDVIDLHATIAGELLENVSRLDGVHLTRAGEIRAARTITDSLRRLS
jgi:lysophospholipase L1-like esterase